MTRRQLASGLLICAALICAAMEACKPKAAPPMKQYDIEGEILKTNPGEQTATIKHGEIKGWMGGMTMDYPIRSREDFLKLHPGDHIKGRVYVQGEDYSVGDLKITPGAAQESTPQN